MAKKKVEEKSKILIIDDDRSVRNILKEIFEHEGYHIEVAEDGEEGVRMFLAEEFELVLCDVKMPKLDGIGVLEQSLSEKPDVPFVMISSEGNVDIAMEATRKGAYDFISKPPDLNRLLVTVRNALDRKTLVKETKELKKKVYKTRDIIGQSKGILKIKKTIEKVAPTDARVLVTGPNGSGKELVARWMHEKSTRSHKPLIEVNCAAIPGELIESELFGHEKGAFTSAHKQRLGKFEQANGGTLFLDEIGDMSPNAQAKVLRALQEGKITRVGGEKDISVDVRIISATNKDLLMEAETNSFRLDLYHRLSVILIHVPSLDERKDDIPLLADSFLTDICKDYGIPVKTFSKDALKALQDRSWSGNIRELRNVIERLVILSDQEITAEDIKSFAFGGNTQQVEENIYEKFSTLQDFREYSDKQFLTVKLEKNKFDLGKTSKEIKIPPRNIEEMMFQFDIVKPKSIGGR